MNTDGLVLELEREALDEGVDIETLLRKSYLVARKLHFDEFEEWIQNEQNGYEGDVPEYRNIGGDIKAWNPYRGWIPMILPAKMADVAKKMPIRNPISSIVDSYKSSNGTIMFTINGEMTDFFNSIGSFKTKYAFFISKSEFHKIISAVRDKILEWAIMLEENGIVGNGLTLTDEEKRVAKEAPIINNYTNNFYGEVRDIDIGQGGND